MAGISKANGLFPYLKVWPEADSPKIQCASSDNPVPISLFREIASGGIAMRVGVQLSLVLLANCSCSFAPSGARQRPSPMRARSARRWRFMLPSTGSRMPTLHAATSESLPLLT